MKSEPKEILAEFGIDVNDGDPSGQYQWKMLSQKAGSPERQRLEKAWSAYVLDRKIVDLPKKPAPASARTADGPASGSGIGVLGWMRRGMMIVLGVIVIALLGLYLQDRSEHKASEDRATSDWQTKYEALKTMLDQSGHDDEHHDEFVLLAEAAKSAIQAGQGSQMLERMNADLASERAGTGPQLITELESHTAQWKIIVEALVMNKEELLDHEKFKGHHEGEL